MFSGSGKLARTYVRGARSVTPSHQCWPFHLGRAVVPFPAPAPVTTGVLRIGYYATASAGGETVTVTYGAIVRKFVLVAGLNSVYLQVTGTATGVTVNAPTAFCIGDAEAGNLAPSAYPIVALAYLPGILTPAPW